VSVAITFKFRDDPAPGSSSSRAVIFTGKSERLENQKLNTPWEQLDKVDALREQADLPC